MLAKLFAYLQYVLPKYWLTTLVYRLARVRSVKVKDFLITQFVRLYKVETSEIRGQLPADFATFNDFFIRELKDDARPVDSARHSMVSPVDGTVSQAGQLHGASILQGEVPKSWLGVPLTSGGAVSGVISLQNIDRLKPGNHQGNLILLNERLVGQMALELPLMNLFYLLLPLLSVLWR